MPLSQADQARANELAKRAAAAFAESDLAQVRTLYGEVLAIAPGHPEAVRRGRPQASEPG